MSARPCITVVFLISVFLLLHTVSHGKPVVLQQHLRDLPYVMDGWKGEERQFDDDVIEAAGVSDYTNRPYFKESEPVVQLYVGYYASQATGDTIHSPKNCLPGAGWDPIESKYATIPISTKRQIVVNEYTVQKDAERQLVFYWYQGRGRTIASEYVGKFWLVVDAVTRNRTDAALIRVNTPMSDGRERAFTRLREFTQAVFPKLEILIPQ
jgi:EpsI family protein